MRRPIKFRAWDDTNHYYFYNVAIYPDNVAGVQRHNIESEMLKAEYGATHWTELGENAVIEQYTGLKDKNGKEIYEGDIVRDGETILEIKFDEIKDSDFTYYYLGWIMECDTYSDSLCEYNNVVEIIGNIHENPGLLKGDKDE